MQENDNRFRLQINHKIKVPFSSSKVWEIISTPGIFHHYHSFCEKNPVEKWPGIGSIDTLCYYNGITFDRIFEKWLEGEGYDLAFNQRGGGRNFYVSWRILKHDENNSSLSITIKVFQKKTKFRVGQLLRDYLWIWPNLKKYLYCVLRGFEFYITTGKPVRRNQFGYHSWCSPK